MKRSAALLALPLLLTLWPGAAPASPLGRLFFTPAERAAAGEPPAPPSPETRPASAAPRLEGVLQTGGGRTLVWLDGEPHTLEAGALLRFDPAHGAATLDPATAPLRLGDADAAASAPVWRRTVPGAGETAP